MTFPFSSSPPQTPRKTATKCTQLASKSHVLHCRSCFQCLFCLMAGVSTSSAWNRERSERVFWHSQTCTRPRQEKIDAIVHFPQSGEGSGALNPQPTTFIRGICFPEVFSFATFLCETFLLVLVISLSYPLRQVTAPVS